MKSYTLWKFDTTTKAAFVIPPTEGSMINFKSKCDSESDLAIIHRCFVPQRDKY